VVQETYQLIKESFDKKIAIETDIPDSLSIMGDYTGLNLALMNLCTNARDAMPAGGQLRIEARQEGDTAVLTVADTGQGMDKNTVEKCFDPFFTTKEVGKGTGLGLSTTFGIVKSHDGKIQVSSVLNRGTVFNLRFPMIITEEKEEKKDPSEIVKGSGEKVLVVDDELEMLQAMPDLLESLGYQAETATDGEDALHKYKTWQPDVVLMDISMPGMDGGTCIEKILDYDPDAKTVIVSGYVEEEPYGLDDRRKRFVKGYLTKPVEVNELSALLARLLK